LNGCSDNAEFIKKFQIIAIFGNRGSVEL